MNTENQPMQEPPTYTENGNTRQTGQNEPDTGIALISYITLVGLIVAFVMNNDKKQPFASYHIRQAVGLNVTGLALSVINVIPVLGWIVSVIGLFVLLYMNIMGIVNALNKKETPLPILGTQYEEWFKSIQ